MKKALLVVLLLSSLSAWGQNTRWDSDATTTTGVGQMLPVLALPGASVAFYTGCTTLPCVTPAVTYESASSGTACPSNAQVVWQLPIAAGCVSMADSQGNFGGWFQPGVYQYVITVSGHASGPYAFNVAGAGGGVTSIAAGTGIQVSGGTGNITVSASPNAYLTTTLSGNVGSTDTTIPLTSVSGLTSSGEIVIGSEWISYTGISGSSLTGATRGVHLTTPESYSSGAGVYSILVDFSNPSQAPTNYIVTNNGALPTAPIINCNTPSLLGAEIAMQVTCDTYIGANGTFVQNYGSDFTGNVFQSKVGVGPGGGEAPITNSGYLFDTTRQNQSTVPQGFGAGLAGPVESIQPLTITAPSIINFAQPAGSTTWSYECTGTDVDGNTFPGTVASITNGPATITGGEIIVTCPFSAGAYSETIWRTAGGPSQGSIGGETQPATIQDNGVAATPGTPPSTNSSIPKTCVDGEVSCWITTASAPTGSCINGWFDTNQSGSPATLYQCVGSAWVASGASGVSSVNSGTGAITIAAGSNMVVTTTGSTVTLATSGSAGSGTVGSGTQYQDATYPNSGSNATVGALTNKYTLPTGLDTTQLSAVFSGLSANTATVTIQNGDGTTPFTNSNFNGVEDLRQTYPVTPWDVKESGAQCDLQAGFASLTSGSPTLTVTSGYSLSAADVGKYIEMVYEVAGEPTRFDATITSVTNSTTATLSTNAPFTVSEYSMDIGHRDDAAIAAAFGQFSYTRPIEFPVGNCWSDTITVWGQSFHGLSSTRSLVTGLAGDDVFAAYDPANPDYQGQSPDMQIYDMKWEFDPRINASQPWQDVNASGTVTQHAATYRPVGLMTAWANYPLGPGWIKGPAANNTGATNGVAVTTQNSAVICIPSTETEPPVGQTIIFPYFSTVFTSTVSSLTGAGCAGGTNPLTMAAAFPNTSGYTTSQSEWMAGTSVQNIQTAIPSGTRATVTITAYSITSNVVTFTASNSYSAGQIANISGFPTSTFLNGLALTVLSSGLSGSQFEANFTHANASATEAGSASIFPFTLTLANPITPPLTPNWAGTGSNVAPYGLVQIDGEQFSYFGDSAYPAALNSTPSITLTAGAQNSTSAAAHSVDATIVPLNPFQPTWPWPVLPSLNTETMPANATYFPAWDIGNAAWAEPWSNGTYPASGGGLSFARMHDITMTILDFGAGSGGGTEGGPNAFQESNATTGMYITRLPFKSKFYNLHIIDPQFGIFEGEPSINAYGLFNAYPTANGSSWDNITIQSAGYDTLFIGGQNDSKTNFLTFCQNGGETGTSNPNQPLGVVGCGAAWIWGGTYDDKSGGGGGSDNAYTTHDNWYIEAEEGSQEEMQPYYEFNCGICTYGNAFGGGTIFVEGSNNNFKDASIVAGSNAPLINYGASTTMSHIAGLGSGAVGNTYGGGSVLNYGPNASLNGNVAGNAFGPYGNLALGTMTTVDGQTGDSFATGNDATSYVSPSSAMIYPYEFGDYTYDSTAPISLSHHLCAISSGSGCYQALFINNSYIAIGPGQRIGIGSYVAHYAIKTPLGANSMTFDLRAVDNGSGSCTTPSTVYSATISSSGAGWTQLETPPFSFSSSTGCYLAVEWTHGATADTMQVAYLVFSPVWTSVTLPVNTPTEGGSCPTPGAFLGSDSSYIYVCASGGTVKRVGIS